MKAFTIAGVVGCAMVLVASNASADPLHRSNYRHAHAHDHRLVNRVIVTRPAPIRTVTTVSALSLRSLPAGYVRFIHDDETFYYSEGVYYKKQPHGFIVAKPRSGFRVATLPRGYRIIREGNVTFFSYNNTRYRKANGFFIVV